MNKRAHYGRKIKKTKNLYRKKKTAGQKVFGTVMLVLAVSAIAFLGFCIGKPLLDYLGNIGTKDIPEWTPQASYSEQQGSDVPEESAVPGSDDPEETAVFHTTSGVETANDVQSGIETRAGNEGSAGTTIPAGAVFKAVEAPASALSNRSSLSAVLAKAKANGYDAVVIQLKDRSGYFRYITEIEDTEKIVTGSMTLDEIMGVFKENDMTPIAEIAVLSDNKGCETFPDISYKIVDEPEISWIEWKEQIRWANPESDATREYFAQVSAELVTAGFENILLTDVVFPVFQRYDFDRNYIDARYGAADRYKMLYNVIKAGNTIEVRASDVLADEFGRSAEILYDTSKLHDNKIALVISKKDFPTESGYPADAKSLVETVLSMARKKTGDLPIIPVIDGQSFEDAEKVRITEALRELGCEGYIMR